MQYQEFEKWPYRDVKPEDVPILISRYQAGESSEKISEDFIFSKDLVLKVLKDNGVHIKTRKENRFSMGFSINEDAFVDVGEPECAYFFGWLLTDGCLRETKYGHQIGLELSLIDLKVVESLSKYVKSGNKISIRHRNDKRTGNTYSMCSFTFQYAPITARLISLGLEARKSTRESCPDEFLLSRDFWRGVLEGDGYLSKLSGSTKMQICGSETLCSQWHEYCKSTVPNMHMTITADPKGNGLFHTYSGRFDECKTVLDSLYLGVPEHMRLERKYNLYVGRYYDGIDPNRAS
jgi:hypothetical protein